ncbi:MAG TPA: MoaD/ThiS family protein [Chloroflexota bacterium]
MIRVNVLLFAAHRETMGPRKLECTLPDGSTVESVYGELVAQEPRMADLRAFTTFALNRQMVEPCTVVRDGDEIALLQPVSGGCHD